MVEARQAVEEAKRIGEEPSPAKSLVDMVVQRESIPGQDRLTEKELRDEALTFLMYANLRIPIARSANQSFIASAVCTLDSFFVTFAR